VEAIRSAAGGKRHRNSPTIKKKFDVIRRSEYDESRYDQLCNCNKYGPIMEQLENTVAPLYGGNVPFIFSS
jgi:hypothetical protein